MSDWSWCFLLVAQVFLLYEYKYDYSYHAFAVSNYREDVFVISDVK